MYNPFTKHIAQIPQRIDPSLSIQPLNTYKAHAHRRRNSYNIRMNNPTHNPEDLPLKQKLMNEQLKNMEVSLDIECSNLQRVTAQNASQITKISELSALNQLEAEKTWQLQTEGALNRSRRVIESMHPLLPARNIPILQYQGNVWQYDAIRQKQLLQLRRIQDLENQYARQTELSRLTFNKLY